MKITRFTGPDMRMTIARVRDVLGPDAVILSNRKIDSGVEVVAAVDYDESLLEQVPQQAADKGSQDSERDVSREEIWDDVRYGRNISRSQPKLQIEADVVVASRAAPQPQSQPTVQDDAAFKKMQSELRSLRGLLVNQLSGMAWDNETKYHPLRARLLQRLIALGLSPQLAREISEQIDERDDIDHNWRMALGILAHRLPVQNNSVLENGGIYAVVGATGVGKTTTIAKLAARYILRHGPGRVGLITTDNYRVAAHEQLRSYARILGAPMRIAADENELQQALDRFSGKDLVLIDTAGMSQRDMRLNQQLALLQIHGQQAKVLIALASNHQRGVLNDVLRAFNSVRLAGTILTKVDETTSLGGGLSVAIENNLPIAYISDGQQVPEDLHVARAHSLVSRSVAIMQEVGVGMKDDSLSQTIGGMAAYASG